MKTSWFKNCKSEEDKKKLRAQLVEAEIVLYRLAEILQQDLDESIRGMSNRDNVRNASNLEDLTAHYLGEQNTLRKVITLLDIKGK